MNRDIANIVKDKISDLPFIDRISGLVRTLSYTETVDGQTYQYKYPISCDVTYDDCVNNERYKDMIPNSDLRSLIYFEDNGANILDSNGRGINFTSNIRLVCWLNIKKFDTTDCSVSGYVASHIIRRLLTSGRFSSGIYNDIHFVISQIPEKTSNIFQYYTYSEASTQYLLYPYDYFALDIKVMYSVMYNCLINIDNADIIC